MHKLLCLNKPRSVWTLPLCCVRLKKGATVLPLLLEVILQPCTALDSATIKFKTNFQQQHRSPIAHTTLRLQSHCEF